MATPATIEIRGVDGSTWTISGPGQGLEGVELALNPSGLLDAPVTVLWNSTAFQVGATPGGFRTNKRDVVFACNVFAIPGSSWEEVDSAWRKAWSYERDSTLTITTENSSRSLKLRLTEAPETKMRKDPRLSELSVITMTCAAGDPYYYEADYTNSWKSTIDTNAIDPSTGAKYIEYGEVWVSNPTDVPIWLKWVLKGPGRWMIPDFSWGADEEWEERKILLPSQAEADGDVVINTDPMEDQAVSTKGTQYWARMNGVSFLFPVPPYTRRTRVPVSISGAAIGTGLQVRCPRPWSRPWGLQ